MLRLYPLLRSWTWHSWLWSWRRLAGHSRDRDKEELAGHVVDLLQGKKEMLADYFSLYFEMIGDRVVFFSLVCTLVEQTERY